MESSYGGRRPDRLFADGSPAVAWQSGSSTTADASRASAMRSCLDSWAVLAWLDGEEPAAEMVAQAVARERPAMSWINLVEVHYRLARDHGGEEADRTLSELRSRITEDLPAISAMRAVAGIKAAHPIALADCFAIALAAEEGAALLTGDPEIVERAEHLPCPIEDLRSNPS
jgi:predicted nucleic acid-binding protein